MKLDEEQLNHYLINILQIPNCWKEIYLLDSLQLLKDIIIRHVTRVYFHNLQIASAPLEERRVPTIPEIIDICLRGDGGNCLHINYFMRILLLSIGYEVTTIAGTIGNFSQNHVMNIVQISDEESYIVDVACGCPSSVPVPLHALPFVTKSCGGSLTEFRKIGDNEYAKFQVGGGFFRPHLEGDKEKVLITFNLTPVDFDFFNLGMTRVWKDETVSPFCRNLFLFRQYFCEGGNREVLIPDGNDSQLEFILVFGKHVLFGSEKRREVLSFTSYEEMVPLVLLYFPKIDKEILLKSFDYLKTMEPIPVRI